MPSPLQYMLADALRQQAPGSGVMTQPDGMPLDAGMLAPTPAPNPDLLELQYLAQQSPEQLQAQFRPFDDQQAILDKQMMMAQQMRQPAGEFSSPLGAALGGLGGLAGSIGGAVGQSRALGGMQALAGQKQKDAASRVGDYAKFATAFGF